MTLNAIIANFQTFKLVDLLDIIIISFLIYQLLGIVNRTRAGQLFKGALLVMAVYLVAETLNMRTVTWLLNSLLQVGLLGLQIRPPLHQQQDVLVLHRAVVVIAQTARIAQRGLTELALLQAAEELLPHAWLHDVGYIQSQHVTASF